MPFHIRVVEIDALKNACGASHQSSGLICFFLQSAVGTLTLVKQTIQERMNIFNSYVVLSRDCLALPCSQMKVRFASIARLFRGPVLKSTFTVQIISSQHCTSSQPCILMPKPLLWWLRGESRNNSIDKMLSISDEALAQYPAFLHLFASLCFDTGACIYLSVCMHLDHSQTAPLGSICHAGARTNHKHQFLSRRTS